MSWLDYVGEHGKGLGSREQLLLSQALEAYSLIRAADPNIPAESAILAAVELVAKTGHHRALEHNTEALYVLREQKSE